MIMTTPISWEKGEFVITTDKSSINFPVLHHLLSVHSYWATNIPRETLEKAINNSVTFSVLQRGRDNAYTFVGFARVVTDSATFGYLADVIISEKFRGQGLGKWLISTIMSYEGFKSLRTWMLQTKDAQGLYKQYGWKTPANPERIIQIKRLPEEVYGPLPLANSVDDCEVCASRKSVPNTVPA